jgi:hypothetical protein
MSFPFGSVCDTTGPTGPAGASPAGPSLPGAAGPTGPGRALQTYSVTTATSSGQTVLAGASLPFTGTPAQVGGACVIRGADTKTFTILQAGLYQIVVQVCVASSATFALSIGGSSAAGQNEAAWVGGTNAAAINTMLERTFFLPFAAGATVAVTNIGAATATLSSTVGLSSLFFRRIS